MRNAIVALLLMLCLVGATSIVHAQDGFPVGVGIDPQLGKDVPLKAEFSDESGKPVTLGNLVTRPTVLMLVYYQCPNVCTPLMEQTRSLIDQMDLKIGTDYSIVSVSIDENEDPTVAAEKKVEILKGLKTPIPEDAWRFLTASAASIKALTAAVGFRFAKQEGGLAHPASLIILSPQGKITRYVTGTSYVPADVEMALRQAAKGTVTATRPVGDASMGPVRDTNIIASFCFFYNPEQGKYVLNITRLVGVATLVVAICFVGLAALWARRRHGEAKP